MRKAVPNDPWGRPYQYVNPGVKGEVDVFSYEKKNEKGTLIGYYVDEGGTSGTAVFLPSR